jgi:hypothetical protein
MATTIKPRLSAVPNPISDALIDGFVDAREGRYCNAYPVGSDCWRAYEQSYCDEAAAGAVRVRIAGGEPIHAIEADLDAREQGRLSAFEAECDMAERKPGWVERLLRIIGIA